MSEEIEYLCWVHDREDDDYCEINRSANDFPSEWKAAKGVSCLDDIPEELVYGLDINSGVKLTDSIRNPLSLYFVSDRLKVVLEKHSDNIEFHKISLLNHKGKKTKKEYYLANTLELIDCLDLEKSEYVTSNVDNESFSYLKKVVFKEGGIPEGLELFRIKQYPDAMMVTEKLAKIIRQEEECDGLFFVYSDEYNSSTFW